jgi:hypothetical protein
MGLVTISLSPRVAGAVGGGAGFPDAAILEYATQQADTAQGTVVILETLQLLYDPLGLFVVILDFGGVRGVFGLDLSGVKLGSQPRGIPVSPQRARIGRKARGRIIR